MTGQKSFTLIELLVVIALIGLLGSILLVSLKGAKERAEIAKTLEWATSLHHVLGADAVGVWNFDEGSGINASDLSGYMNNGTLVGNPQWVKNTPSGQGSALNFNGGQYVELYDPTSLKLTGDQTIALWLYPTDFSDRRNPYAKAYGGEGTITQETNGTVTYYYGTCGGNCSPYQGFSMSSAFKLNTWVHLVLMRKLSDASNRRLYWYKNGKLVNQTPANYPAAIVSSLQARIGRGYVSDYYGIIDDVRIYSQALSTAEIQKIYAEGLERIKLVKSINN